MIFLAYKKEIPSPAWSMIIYTNFLGLSCGMSFVILIALLHTSLDSTSYKTFFQNFYSIVFALGGSAATLVYILLVNKQVEGFLEFTIIAHSVIGITTIFVLIINNKFFQKKENDLSFDNSPLVIEDSQPKNDNTNNSDDLLEKKIETSEKTINTLSFCQIFIGLIKDNFFWFLFTIFILGTGIGSSYSTNLGNMTLSLVGEEYLALSSILFSVSQTTGRFFVLLFSSSRFNFSQIKMLIFISTIYLIFFSLMFFANINLELFILFTIIVGIMYGGFWTVSFSIVINLKIFEAKYFSEIISIILAPSQTLGTCLFNFIIGYIYDSNADPIDKKCFGKKCYETSFLIVSITSLLMLIISITFMILKRKYDKLKQ